MQPEIDSVNRVLREQIAGVRVVRAFVREPDDRGLGPADVPRGRALVRHIEEPTHRHKRRRPVHGPGAPQTLIRP